MMLDHQIGGAWSIGFEVDRVSGDRSTWLLELGGRGGDEDEDEEDDLEDDETMSLELV